MIIAECMLALNQFLFLTLSHFPVLFLFFGLKHHFVITPSPCFHSLPIPCIFLYFALKDIDQLKLIMMLVGTPGPEFLMKVSSESVSVSVLPEFDSLCVAMPICSAFLHSPRSHFMHVASFFFSFSFTGIKY